jgi:hypothetical protein
MKSWMILLIILVVLIGIMVALYFYGNKLQAKQADQRKLMMEQAQNVSLLVIDKKRMKLKEAGLPKIVLEQAPKRYANAKLPIVKAKVGPQIMSLICDEGIYDQIPIKKEVKAQVSGIYIVGVKNLRGGSTPVVEEKKSFMTKLRLKASQMQNNQ